MMVVLIRLHALTKHSMPVWFQQVLAWGAAIVEFALQALIGWKCVPMIDSPLYATTKPSGKSF
jgi:hypothetical protein